MFEVRKLKNLIYIILIYILFKISKTLQIFLYESFIKYWNYLEINNSDSSTLQNMTLFRYLMIDQRVTLRALMYHWEGNHKMLIDGFVVLCIDVEARNCWLNPQIISFQHHSQHRKFFILLWAVAHSRSCRIHANKEIFQRVIIYKIYLFQLPLNLSFLLVPYRILKASSCQDILSFFLFGPLNNPSSVLQNLRL